MNTIVAKSIGEIVKGSMTGQNVEAIPGVVAIVALVAPHIIDHTALFAEKIMERNYRFQAGPVVLEPVSSKSQ